MFKKSRLIHGSDKISQLGLPFMSYQVIARKFRPATFEEVIGQDAIVKTLKNALKSEKLAHAYLFCGLRGTGKTTLARLLAKAMNCQQLTENTDPCGECASCKHFQSSQQIDFIEIDGASHRGIDDIKSLVDMLGYSSVNHYKIILIDEVHMLTKEAFNALLKTLEEPPEHVKFIFATTEPHKLPSTILSRCQRFDLTRISPSHIIFKLKKVAAVLGLSVDEIVYELIAERAEGSLRDAESLFERIISGSEGPLKLETVYELLGFFNLDMLEELDLTIGQKNLKNVFILADKLYASGKDIKIFFDQFRQHLRHILCSKLGLSAFIKNYPLKSSSISCYELHETSYLLEVLTEQLKTSNFDKKIDVEALLMHMVQSKNRVNLQTIVDQLTELSSNTPLEASIPVSRIQSDLPIEAPKSLMQTAAPIEVKEAPVEILSITPPSIQISEPEESLSLKTTQFYDTLLQFTAVELEGSLKK